MKKIHIFTLIIIIISFLAGIYLYDFMPEKIASHWNAKGQVDEYMSKFWGLFLMPIVCIGVFFLLLIIPKIDPLKKNVDKFRKYFDSFIFLIVLFLVYIYALTIIWNLNIEFDMNKSILPAIGLLFFYSGVLIGHAKRNWFIGIRTPWTLSSDIAWDKTHKLGGVLFKIAGILAFVGLIFPNIAILIIMIPVILFTIFLFIYSYVVYKKTII
ncbi:DUF1648 domain-containing protein [Patescibacteria group bacterium]|nr:DUF1648 domain-containing protein [Patescibacteria group bacterium]MBU3923020.1 DUF1648 domain-containing protein [Patescibacteria group bacterium]